MFLRGTLLLFCLTWVVLAQGKQYSTIDIIGDSISVGISNYNPDDASWTDMLQGMYPDEVTSPTLEKSIYDFWPDIEFYNCAFAGAMASDWASTESAHLQTVLGHKPDLVLILIGGNDFLSKCGDSIVTGEEASEICQCLLDIIMKLQDSLPQADFVVIGYYDLFDGMSQNLTEPLTIYKNLSEISIMGNSVIRDVAESTGCRYVSIYEDFMHHGYGRFLGDPASLEPVYFKTPLSEFNIHPVIEGHRVIFENVYSTLEDMKNASHSMGWFFY